MHKRGDKNWKISFDECMSNKIGMIGEKHKMHQTKLNISEVREFSYTQTNK